MSTRDDYTPLEWEAIRRAPAESSLAVEEAGQPGFLGRRQGRKAVDRAFGDALARYAGLGLVDSIAAAVESEGRLVASLRSGSDSYLDRALETARAARVAIEASGTREELEAYVESIIAASESAAAATKGTGGERISRAEALVLTRLANALGKSGYEPPAVG